MRNNAGRLKAIIAFELRKVNQTLSENEKAIQELRAKNRILSMQATRLEAEQEGLRGI